MQPRDSLRGGNTMTFYKTQWRGNFLRVVRKRDGRHARGSGHDPLDVVEHLFRSGIIRALEAVGNDFALGIDQDEIR